MKIAILGAGNEGCALAADLSYKKNDVILIKTSNSINDENFNYLSNNNGKIKLVESTGEEKLTYINTVTRNLSYVSECDLIFITIQTTYHEELIKKISSYLIDNQIVVISPGYLSTAYFLKYCNANISIVETESSFIDCRLNANGIVNSFFRNVRNPIGVYPTSNLEFVKSKMNKLGFPFVYVSTIEAALHNPNLVLHTSGAIMNITSIEKKREKFCLYGEGFTEATLRVLESLDNEKNNILKSLNLKEVSYYKACKFRNSLDDSEDAKQVFLNYTVIAKDIKGPSTIYSRYITEDVSQGLVMLESLGKYLNVPTPICTSLIDLSSAALNINFRENGRNIENLCLDNIQKILCDLGKQHEK